MPPTSPCGIPVVSVVFARLVVDNEDWGIHPFVVELSDGQQMCDGIESKILPARGMQLCEDLRYNTHWYTLLGGSYPVNHGLTYFRRARVPSSALLGAFEKPKDARKHFTPISLASSADAFRWELLAYQPYRSLHTLREVTAYGGR